jgi:phosphohistidine phosphatase
MIIFVMRHGEAEPYKKDDQSRHLTKFGATQSEHAAKWMAKLLSKHTASNKVDLTIVSPYVRTLETLGAVEKFLPLQRIVKTTMVTPVGNPNSVQDLIDGELLADDSIHCLLVISHMPLVSLLSDVICSGFNARIFDTSDVLMINYDAKRSKGGQVDFYQSLT